MAPRAASNRWPRSAGLPSRRDDVEGAKSLEAWLNELCIEMDELTELAKSIADDASETITQPRTELRVLPPTRHRKPGGE